ncbi:hypothetical protein HNR26_002752 [Rhizobium rosettiformans]|uniref:Uncharacterized protein n=2 Tax=Rhizobium rosettiformans TaxID=1368430 RepID=A0A4S8PVA0_9HYPH|nr:hypothetical protein [Rhizobium rosettiformans]MBB5276674.1 hypothetical protein [Rhizobium rosettiformans]THV35477.1 hypothetical protein FAA86_13180 [Rhizobium rosettiformans W3]
MVDLFKRMFGNNASLEASRDKAAPEPEARSAARADEARLAARRAQISNDLFELQQIAMAELALRREQDAAAAKAGFEADDQTSAGRVLTV